mmetsp:Transcript_35187/g.60732  ORF Transcript_35187/g.60732 Transcript_35187/m.60732 type:complete len:294 (-) Transcript_35187:265-1146(-)
MLHVAGHATALRDYVAAAARVRILAVVQPALDPVVLRHGIVVVLPERISFVVVPPEVMDLVSRRFEQPLGSVVCFPLFPVASTKAAPSFTFARLDSGAIEAATPMPLAIRSGIFAFLVSIMMVAPTVMGAIRGTIGRDDISHTMLEDRLWDDLRLSQNLAEDDARERHSFSILLRPAKNHRVFLDGHHRNRRVHRPDPHYETAVPVVRMQRLVVLNNFLVLDRLCHAAWRATVHCREREVAKLVVALFRDQRVLVERCRSQREGRLKPCPELLVARDVLGLRTGHEILGVVIG